MATSEDLVATGQQYGDRQKNVAALQLAGQPLSSQSASVPGQVPASAPPVGGAGEPVGAGAAPVPTDLGGYDVLDGREPAGAAPGAVAPQTTSTFQAQLATTQNQVMADLFRHTSNYLQG